jgi:hypothetical protein
MFVSLLIAAGWAVQIGCGDGVSPPSRTPAGPVQVVAASQTVVGAAPTLRKPWHMPSPTQSPNGGARIDMRGSTNHVLALERQPDGSYRRVCRDGVELAPRGLP